MIKSIHIARQTCGQQQAVAEIHLIAGRGILGDRNFDQRKWPGQNITFVEAEEIARYNETCGQAIAEHATRRNVVTEGVRFRGVELCEPCAFLGKLLANADMAKRTC